MKTQHENDGIYAVPIEKKHSLGEIELFFFVRGHDIGRQKKHIKDSIDFVVSYMHSSNLNACLLHALRPHFSKSDSIKYVHEQEWEGQKEREREKKQRNACKTRN